MARMAELAWSAVAGAGTSWLMTYLLHSTVLIASTWVVLRCRRFRPAAQEVLWKTALVAGFVTSTAAMMVATTGPTDHALLTRRASLSGPAAGPARPVPDEVATTRARTDALLWVPEGAAARRLSVRARLTDPSPACRTFLSQGRLAAPDGGADPRSPAWVDRMRDACAASGPWWPAALLGLWLTGAAVAVGSYLYRRRGLSAVRGSLRHAAPRTESLLGTVLTTANDLSAGTGRPALSGTRIRTSDLVNGPCVLPGSVLVVSDRCESELTDAELKAALAHELAHVARGDAFWAEAGRWISALFWLQPLNRLVCRSLADTAELACDEWAVRCTGERYGLASSIARVAEWTVPDGPLIYAIPMAGRDGRGLSERVRRILHPSELPTEPRWLVALVALGLLCPVYWLPTPAATPAVASFVVEEVDFVRTQPAAAGELRVIVAEFRSKDWTTPTF